MSPIQKSLWKFFREEGAGGRKDAGVRPPQAWRQSRRQDGQRLLKGEPHA